MISWRDLSEISGQHLLGHWTFQAAWTFVASASAFRVAFAFSERAPDTNRVNSSGHDFFQMLLQNFAEHLDICYDQCKFYFMKCKHCR
jgi:hypothetical protein